MGFKFRKSKKIAPGVRVNFNKKSSSVTFGSKGLHHTISSTGKKTTSAGIPGSGLYYTSSSGGGGGSKNTDNTSTNFTPNDRNNNSPNQNRNNGNKNPIKYLLYCAIAVAILLMCAYHSLISAVICVPVFIYFWKHKELKRRKYYLGITAFLFAGCLVSLTPSTIDTISFGSNKSIVMDINSSKKITYSIDPEDGNTDELKLVSSTPDILSANLDKSDGKITISSHDNTGNTTIYLKDSATDATSKSIKVTVEDKKAIAEAKKKAEEENKRKLEEEKKKKEQTRIAAEKKKAAEATATQVTTETTTVEQEEMVWVSNTGSKYHSNPNCSNMKNPSQHTLSYAKSMGLSPCSKCY